MLFLWMIVGVILYIAICFLLLWLTDDGRDEDY